ncbi:MAG: VWA domain-containing protein [Deltaproteobacteria bacterium]|nr:VWA domain-containing protein [Deltaproteobacteria bacterium]
MRLRFLCALIIALAPSACRDRPIFSGLGTSFTERTQLPSGDGGVNVQETFRQPTEQPRKVDILFVVDNSGSMGDEQTNLRNNIATFINELTTSGADFQIGVTTTDLITTVTCDGGAVVDGGWTGDRGQLKAAGGNPKILTSTMSNVATLFQQNADQGTTGWGIEKGLEAVRLALSEPLISTTNAGFLRSDSALAVVIVTDEDDCSLPLTCPYKEVNQTFCFTQRSILTPTSEYVSFLTALKGGDLSKVLFGVIGGPDYPRFDVDAGGSAIECRQTSDCALAGRVCIGGKCWAQPNERATYATSASDCFYQNVDASTCFMDQQLAPGGGALVPRDGGAAAGPYVCLAPGGNAGARAATRYIDVVQSFGQNGFFGSICDSSFSESLRQIGRGIAGLFCKVPLTSGYNIDPNAAAQSPSGISVAIDGVAVPSSDIQYNCPEPGGSYAKGSISLAQSYCQYPNPTLAPGATVTVNYTYRTSVTTCASDSDCPGSRCGRCGFCDDQICEVGFATMPAVVNQVASGPYIIVRQDGGVLPKDGTRYTYQCPSTAFPNGYVQFSGTCPRLSERVEVLFQARDGNPPPTCGTSQTCAAGSTCGRCGYCE